MEEIREDSEQGVHGRYKKIQYGMFTGETGRSVGNAECYGERWGDSARTQGDPGRIQGDSGETERCGMRILENHRKIQENPVKNLVHDRYRKIRAERSTEDTRSFMDKTGRFGGDTGRHWRYKRDTRSFMGDTGRTEEDIGKFGMDICGKYTEI
jgi:hypothetical protein